MSNWLIVLSYIGGLFGLIVMIYLVRVLVKAVSGVFKNVGKTYNPDCDDSDDY